MKFKFKPGDKVTVNLPGSPFHGQTFEVVKYNGRHQFAIMQVTKRFGDYKKGWDLRFAGTLLSALEAAS